MLPTILKAHFPETHIHIEAHMYRPTIAERLLVALILGKCALFRKSVVRKLRPYRRFYAPCMRVGCAVSEVGAFTLLANVVL